MKKHFSACLIVTFFTSIYALAGSSSAEDSVFENDIKESQNLKTVCEQAGSALEELIKQPLEKNESLKSKKDYDTLLTAFKSYPRMPESSWKGVKRIINSPQLYENADLTGIENIYRCDPVKVFDAAKILINTAKSLAINREEQRKLAEAILERATYNSTLGQPNLLQQLLDFNLVTLLMGNDIVTVSDPIYVELMHLDLDASHLKRELVESDSLIRSGDEVIKFSKLNKSDQKTYRRSVFMELRGVDALRLRFAWLLRRIKT